jgi:hypothetical protein
MFVSVFNRPFLDTFGVTCKLYNLIFFSSALPWCGALGPSFCCPRTRLWRLVAALRLGCFGSPSSDPWLPLRTGSACSAFRFTPTRFPADLPLRGKAPRPERPIPPQTTHTPLSHSLHSRHAAYSAALLHITSHPLRGLEDTTTLPQVQSNVMGREIGGMDRVYSWYK